MCDSKLILNARNFSESVDFASCYVVILNHERVV